MKSWFYLWKFEDAELRKEVEGNGELLSWPVWGTGTLSWGNREQERDKIQPVFETDDPGSLRV